MVPNNEIDRHFEQKIIDNVFDGSYVLPVGPVHIHRVVYLTFSIYVKENYIFPVLF